MVFLASLTELNLNVKFHCISLHFKGIQNPAKNLRCYFLQNLLITCKSSHQRCSVKKVFLEILQNSQDSTCARVSFLIKLQAAPATLLKKRLQHRCFPGNFAKFLITPVFAENLWWLFLQWLLSVTYFCKGFIIVFEYLASEKYEK